jgi:prepilin-type processing-associated H-X9-DG protein
MRRSAFTLVEALVVLSVIVLLAAILLPSFHRASAMARSTYCKNNLAKISTAFATNAARGFMQAETLAGHFPQAEQWPGVPYNACPVQDIFNCPEKPPHELRMPVGDPLEGLLYSCRNRGFEIPFNSPSHKGLGNMNLGTREGADGRGKYMEVGLDDNAPVRAHYMDGDGHDGLLRIYLNDGALTIKLMMYTCGERNCVTYHGEPVFLGPEDPPGVTIPGDEMYGWLGPRRSKNGMEVPLRRGGAETSYGMTRGAEGFGFPSHRALVMDFDEQIVDPEEPDVQAKLDNAARHLGRVNVLFADNSVRSEWPTTLDPLLPGSERIWRP